jgi:acyl-CoA thioester hydrolase
VTDAFRHRTTIQVRFRDTDAFGHVNNAVFFSYVELARVRYLVDVLEPEQGFEGMPLILARVECDFRSPIFFGQEVTVASRVGRIGGSSIAMTHRMTATPDDRVVGDVQSVLVTYDYAAARPMPVPEDWRERMGSFEQTAFVTDAPQAASAAAG